jgi:hypothetical protein
MTTAMTTPFFVFLRMPKIERESGCAIAGLLVIDHPANKEMTDEWEKGIDFIIGQLKEQIDQIPHGEYVIWPPDTTAEFLSEEAIKAWTNGRTQILVTAGALQ